MSMLETIKKAALAAGEAGAPVAVLFGEVAEVNPLRVLVDSRFELTEDFLLVPAHIELLADKDRLVLLRLQGGQQYFVLGKVGNNGANT